MLVSAPERNDETSGPVIAIVFHRLLALTFLVAWWSLGRQVDVLIGRRGLLPLASYLDEVAPRVGLSFWDFPSIFWWGASDDVLRTGVWVGAFLALLALAGLRPRVCIALSTALYLSYATAARTFLSFQWDNLLLECGALAVFLPTDRPARWIHVLFRLLLFKLYWESGVAKWQSYLGDWQDGSAMTYYYETAPLPTWIAWFAHHLPPWWHHLESWLVLVLELLVPFGIFGPRHVRLTTVAIFTAFQIANASTANYGFFCYLSAALGLFLLADRDLVRTLPFLARLAPPVPATATPPRWLDWGRAVIAVAVTVSFLAVSVADAAINFSGSARAIRAIQPWQSLYAPWRLVNTYHLFGHITRERIEPQFETFDGHEWTEHDFSYKPGDLRRPPPFVAPHQPRVDFQLWFYGLGFQHGTPTYVAELLDRLCHDPTAVQPLFPTPLPSRPQAVRIVFWRYRFTSPAEHGSTGTWWTRERVALSSPLSCGSAAQSDP